MSVVRRPRQTQALSAAVVSLVLALVVVFPATAVVRFEPTREVVPDRWTADVEITVDWAGISVRIPASWDASIKREPPTGIGSGAAVLVAFGPGDTLCMLDMFDAEQVETWQDAGVEAARELTIAGHRSERFDDMLGTGAAITSAYSVYAPSYVYSLLCSADKAPEDRWLSIVETLELR
jgi:hypothetical protein